MMFCVSSISRPRWPARRTSPGGAVPVGGAASVAHELLRADAECAASSSTQAIASPDEEALNRRAAEDRKLDTGSLLVGRRYGVLSNSIRLWLPGFKPLVSRMAAARCA